MTSWNVLFCLQPKDIDFTAMAKERNQNLKREHILNKLESEKSSFKKWLKHIITQN